MRLIRMLLFLAVALVFTAGALSAFDYTPGQAARAAVSGVYRAGQAAGAWAQAAMRQ